MIRLNSRASNGLALAVLLLGSQAFGQQGRVARIVARSAAWAGSPTAVASAIPLLDSGKRLEPTDPSGRDLFGSVALQGSVAVIGAVTADNAVGAAFVFEFANGAWTQRAKLVAGDRQFASAFGDDVALHGDTIAVTAPRNDLNTGAVYVFQKNGGVWSQQAKLTGSDSVPGTSFFGTCVALGQDLVVVGDESGVVPGVGEAGIADMYSAARARPGGRR